MAKRRTFKKVPQPPKYDTFVGIRGKGGRTGFWGLMPSAQAEKLCEYAATLPGNVIVVMGVVTKRYKGGPDVGPATKS
jgi:hypothetical protein